MLRCPELRSIFPYAGDTIALSWFTPIAIRHQFVARAARADPLVPALSRYGISINT